MPERFWHIVCPECKKETDVSIGNYRLIIQTDLEFAQKPEFHCLRCNCKCEVEYKEKDK